MRAGSRGGHRGQREITPLGARLDQLTLLPHCLYRNMQEAPQICRASVVYSVVAELLASGDWFLGLGFRQLDDRPSFGLEQRLERKAEVSGFAK